MDNSNILIWIHGLMSRPSYTTTTTPRNNRSNGSPPSTLRCSRWSKKCARGCVKWRAKTLRRLHLSKRYYHEQHHHWSTHLRSRRWKSVLHPRQPTPDLFRKKRNRIANGSQVCGGRFSRKRSSSSWNSINWSQCRNPIWILIEVLCLSGEAVPALNGDFLRNIVLGTFLSRQLWLFIIFVMLSVLSAG